jgi:hypothetical protein
VEPQQREALVAALAALSEEDRRIVLREARSRGTAPSVKMPWEELRKAIAIVHGTPADAIIDTEKLYDD